MRWKVPLLFALLLAGCATGAGPDASAPGSQPTEGEVAQLLVQKAELEAEVADLRARLAAATAAQQGSAAQNESVHLVNERYRNDAADADPMAYRKTATADLDGDGQAETITVATTAQFIPESRTFAWDDGHPWYVYADEADGTRTTLFADWVQLGRLRVQVGMEPTSVIITSEQGAGTSVYRVVYKGPQQTEATELVSFRTNGHATFPPESGFAE